MADEASVDVAVVGGGPAGLSVVRCCVELGLSCVLFDDRPRLGGQLLDINHPIQDYLGAPVASGSALAEVFARHALASPARVRIGARVTGIDVQRHLVETARERVCARFVLLAMGARARMLGVPGERERSAPADRLGLPAGIARGSRVVVIGGGDNAAEAALHAAASGARVSVLARAELRATPARQRALREHPNIHVKKRSPVAALGHAGVVGVAGEVIPADRVLVRIGYTPNSELVQGQLECDREGYILTGRAWGTSASGVAAIGDVINDPLHASIANAVGQAPAATKALLSASQGRPESCAATRERGSTRAA